MKRKLFFGAIAALAISLSFVTAKADVDGEEGPGGGTTVNCDPPTSNTCIIIHRPWPLGDDTRKGVATVRF